MTLTGKSAIFCICRTSLNSLIDRFLLSFLNDFATELSSCSGMSAMGNIVDKGKAMAWVMYVLLKE
jgi:hypothetical protein